MSIENIYLVVVLITMHILWVGIRKLEKEVIEEKKSRRFKNYL